MDGANETGAARKEAVKISASEWTVMEVLWGVSGPGDDDMEGLFLPEILALLPRKDASRWSTKTVQTFLKRLSDKGAVKATKKGRVLRYEAALKYQDCIRYEADHFLDRVFRGNASTLVAHFLSEGDFDRGELEDLQRLLEERKG